VLEDVAVPLVFLANPTSTANEAQDTIHLQQRRPTADVRKQADQAATDANGNVRCSYCGQVLTPKAGKPILENMIMSRPTLRAAVERQIISKMRVEAAIGKKGHEHQNNGEDHSLDDQHR
jgi:DNA-binding TFAR19-related protein (PDSD5 family)